MKVFSAIFFGVLCLAASIPAVRISAAPSTKIVHVSLHATANVQADSDGFFSLASIADLTGGDTARRARLASVQIGRAPLPDLNRSITQGDIALKLRQAGLDPNRDAAFEGAKSVVVTLAGDTSPTVTSPQPAGKSGKTTPDSTAPQVRQLIVHRGESVKIMVQDDNVTVTANGVARQDGALGDTIQVHRDGVMTDITVTVIDVRTVQLGI